MKIVNKPNLYASLDLEMTGLDPAYHKICQLAAWVTGYSPSNKRDNNYKGYFVSDLYDYHSLVDEKSLKVNGFTYKRLDAAPHPKVAYKKFSVFLRRWSSTFTINYVGFGIKSDLDLLKEAMKKEGFCLQDGFIVDITELQTSSTGLGKALKQNGFIQGDAHDALSDAYQASLIFHKLNEETERRII